MSPNLKKNLVGLGALLSTLVSVWMWIWYGSLPSFDKTTTSFNEEETTWENFEVKQQEVVR